MPDTESSPHGLAPESGENSILSKIKETEAKLNRLHDQKVSWLERAALTMSGCTSAPKTREFTI